MILYLLESMAATLKYINIHYLYYHSRNTSKIETVSRMFSAGFFGLGSKKIGKQWHCNSCGSDF